MISVSTTFQSIFDAGTDRYDHKMQLTLTDGTVLTEDDFGSERFKTAPVYEDDCSNADSFDIGSAVIGAVSFQIMNHDGFFDDYDLEGAKLILYECPDGASDIQKGIYYITEAPEDYSAVLSIEAQDRMYLLERYVFQENTLITNWSNVTALQVVNDILTRNGIAQISTMPNGTLRVPHVELGESTDRTVLFYITQITGTAARFSNEGILTLRQYDQTSTPISVSRVHDGQISKKSITVTGVSISDYNKSITKTSGSDGYVLRLEENPFVVDTTIDSILSILASAYVGLSFSRMSLSCHASPAWEPMDRFTITDAKGGTHTGYITNMTYTSNGKSIIAQAAVVPERQNSNRYTQSTKIVEMAREITSNAVSTYDEQMQQLSDLIVNGSGLYRIEEKQDDGSVIYYMADAPTKETSTVIWKHTAQGLMVSKDGGVSFAIDSNGNALFNVLTAHGINADWINAGTMTADHIAGGEMVIGGAAASTKDGKITVKNASDVVTVTLDKNGIDAIAGQIGSWKITEGYLQGSFYATIPPDTDDLLAMFDYIHGEGTLTDEQLEWMDFDGDGDVDARDAILLKRYLHGIIESPYSDGRTIPTATINVRLNPSSRDYTVYMYAHSVYKGGNITSENMTQRIGLISANISRFSGTVKFDKSIHIDNNKYLYGAPSSDAADDIPLIGLTSSDNLAIGSSSDTFAGNVNVYTGQVTTDHDPVFTVRFDQGDKEKMLQVRSYKSGTNLIGVWVRPPASSSSKSYLGGSDYRWETIYSVNALNTSSDRRLKQHDLYLQDDMRNLLGFYKDLKPAKYYRHGDELAEFGLYAQDVAEALEDNDICNTKIVEESEDGMLSLYYDSIHNMTISVVQNLIKRIEYLEDEMEKMKK